MDCDQILANLHVGSCPTTAEEIAVLTERGISAVLNLQSDEDFQTHRIDWPALRARYSSEGVEVRRAPITDFDDDDLRDKLPEAVRVLTELLQRGHTVFMHCNAGVNRSPSAAICFLHWIEGWRLDEAAQHVSKRHPCAPVMDVVRTATWNRKGGI